MSRHDAIDISSRACFRSAFLVCAALVCAVLAARAQAVLRWERTYGGEMDDIVYEVLQSTDGGYVVGGWTRSFNEPGPWVFKVDSLGEIRWSTTLPSDYYDACIVGLSAFPGGGYVAAGLYSSTTAPTDTGCVYLLRLSEAGDTIRTRLLYSPVEHDCAYDVAVTQTGGIFLTGVIGDTFDGLIARCDSLGYEIWTRSFGGGHTDLLYSIDLTSDGGCVAAGVNTSTPDGPRGWVVRVDSLGAARWVKYYGRPAPWYAKFCTIKSLPDGGFVAAGTQGNNFAEYYLVRLDSLGDTLWTHSYGRPGNFFCDGMCLCADGGFLIVGGQSAMTDTGGGDFWLVKTDRDGRLEWTSVIGDSDWDRSRAVQQTADGGYIIVGQTFNYDIANDAYLVKTDAFGSSAIIESPRPEASSRNRLRIYETPDHRLRYYLPEPGRVELEELDAVGRRQTTSYEGRQAVGWHEARLRADGPAGVSFVRLKADCGQTVAKLISLPR